MSNLSEVVVTRADVERVVTQKSAHVPGVLVEAVVSEVNEKLQLVGKHNATTALRADTVEAWINQKIDNEYGVDGFDEVLGNNKS